MFVIPSISSERFARSEWCERLQSRRLASCCLLQLTALGNVGWLKHSDRFVTSWRASLTYKSKQEEEQWGDGDGDGTGLKLV